jgi:Photosynthetic reaction centre cytochrome C subunit
MILRSVVSALGVVVVTGSIAAGQAPAAGGQRAGGALPAPMKNLQILPKDMPQPQVIAIMRAFNAALGVECGHCHVWTKPGAPTNDMAADTKIEKTVARAMMQMTGEINAKVAASIKKPADQIARVECATCHRGAAIPVTPPPPPAPVPAAAAPTTPPAK